ncbi:hypothetical protein QVD17_36752 [Tagetes erecta]|uniref:Uncharacterized protein n=1 Tax=Tagetes erecta TaxID=13708 RepID=A0AAD8JWZ0_TARER|nr:hypothetical protein QVD17_36752 [Tagetes erecta]
MDTSLRLDSPLIYLFCGIGFMLVLIMLALLMLACAEWRLRSVAADGRVTTDVDGDHFHNKAVLHGGDVVVPKIAVIMAGEDIPTYLAAPLSSRHEKFLAQNIFVFI